MIWTIINLSAWGLSGLVLALMLFDFLKVEKAAKSKKD